MKKIVMTVTLGLLLSVSVSAGQIYGTLKEDGRPVPANLEIEVNCSGQQSKGKTDSYGAYSLKVGNGKCEFKLYYKGWKGRNGEYQFPKVVIYSSNNRLRYDFELVPVNGVYELRRK
ncbi:MAG: hypothetical protein WAM70_00025 [Pyrinomonadaceae bacterium]